MDLSACMWMDPAILADSNNCKPKDFQRWHGSKWAGGTFALTGRPAMHGKGCGQLTWNRWAPTWASTADRGSSIR